MKKLILLALGFVASFGLTNAANIQVVDSIAGEDVAVRISGLSSDEFVNLNLVRPNGSTITLDAVADEWGIANTTMFGLHLREAGNYELSAERPFEVLDTSFDIFAAEASSFRSEITLKDPSVLANGKTRSEFEVVAKDAFGNLLEGKPVKVFSSRNSDEVVLNGTTDINGKLEGFVTSNEAGVSTLSVLVDGDILFAKPEIVFFMAEGSMPNVGQGDSISQFLKAQLFTETSDSDIAYFTIEDLADTVIVEKSLSLRVVARDEDGNVVPDFTGKVRFSSSDDDATLPADYTFTSEDQGEHSFFLAFRFSETGTHTLAVHDLQDFRITGEWEGEVVQADGSSNPILSSSVEITKPRPGTYKSNRVTVAGKTVSCDTVKLIDGFTVLGESIEVDQGGNWILQTPTLADGVHEFQAFCADDETVTSNKVPIKIDRTPPAGFSVELTSDGEVDLSDGSGNGNGDNGNNNGNGSGNGNNNNGNGGITGGAKNVCYTPGAEVFVKIGSTEPISSGDCVFQQIPIGMTAEGTHFVGSVIAPTEPGPYNLSCSVADLLGNKLTENNAGEIFVCAGDTNDESGDGGDDIQDIPTPVDFDTIAPTAVSNVVADPIEDGIALRWTPAFDDNGVAEYKVSCGRVDENGNIPVNEFKMIPGDSRSTIFDGLTEGENYSCTIVAIDEEGNAGPASSAVLGMAATNGALESSAPKSPDAGVSETQLWALLALLGLGGGMMFMQRRQSVLG